VIALTTFVTVIFIFFMLVVAHELGHMLAAKWCGMRVDRFQVGFGPPIVRLGSWGETEISIGPFPLGGFVAIHGMTPGDYFPEERAFHDAPLFKRMVAIAAGPFMSLVLAYVLFIVVGSAYGIMQVTDPIRFGEVAEGKVAYKAGIRAGDRVLQANSVQATSWGQLASIINGSAGKPLYLRLERSGHEFGVVVVPESARVPDISDPLHPKFVYKGRIFCAPAMKAVRVGIGESVSWSTLSFADNLKLLVGTIFSPFIKDSLGGPVAIVSAANKASQRGFADVLMLAGQLSLSLGIINLFPIPVLDGGYLLLLLVEFIRGGKRMSLKMQVGLQFAGVILILALLVFITSLDINRLINNTMP